MTGPASTDSHFTKTPDARPVHCSVWLCSRRAALHFATKCPVAAYPKVDFEQGQHHPRQTVQDQRKIDLLPEGIAHDDPLRLVSDRHRCATESEPEDETPERVEPTRIGGLRLHNVGPITGRADTEPRSTDRNYTAGPVQCIGGLCRPPNRREAEGRMTCRFDKPLKLELVELSSSNREPHRFGFVFVNSSGD